jgi:hypothetical protein
MQAGLLYHAQQDATGGIYIEQGRCRLLGELDEVRLMDAWQLVTERFDVLRIAMQWKGFRHPVQVVYRKVVLPVAILDWTNVDSSRRELEFESWLASDLKRGFDLTQPPFLRVALLRFTEHERMLVWTFHHLILDAWAEAIVLAEVMQVYETGKLTEAPAPKFRDYVRWLKSAVQTNANPFWADYLRNARLDAKIGGIRKSHHTLLRQVDSDAEKEVRAGAAASRTTVHSLVLGLWTLFLSAWTKQADTIFGVTVSGRPPELPNAFSHVGVLFNTIPFRFQVDHEESIGALVKRVHANYASLASHELTPLSTIRQAASIARESELFDTVAVFLNHGFLVQGDRLGDCEVRDVAYSSRSSYALTFRVMERSPVTLELLYDESVLERPHAISILESLDSALRHMANGSEQPAGEIVKLLAGAIHRSTPTARPKIKLADARPQLRKLRGPYLNEPQTIG